MYNKNRVYALMGAKLPIVILPREGPEPHDSGCAMGNDKTMKPYAEKFYKGTNWQQCREAYAKSKGYLCEACLKQGIFKPGEIVHHKVHLNPKTILDPKIALSWDNLELLCRECHAQKHGKTKRYKVDSLGRVVIL